MNISYSTRKSAARIGNEKRLSFKTAHTIDKFCEEIVSGIFDQKSAEVFLITSRDYMPKKSVLREISNFIAHPNRDRGFISEDVEHQLNLISTSFEIELTGEGDIVLPKPWYNRVKQYYTTTNPKEKIVEKLEKIFEKRGKKYVSRGIVSGYTKQVISEAVGGTELPSSSIFQKHLVDDIRSFFNKIGVTEEYNFKDANLKDLIVCVLCSLHGCEFKSDYGGVSVCFLGFNEERKLQLRADLDPYAYTEKEHDLYDGQLFSYPIIETEIGFEEYLDCNLEKEYEENRLIENSVNPVYAERNSNNGDLLINRSKIFSILEGRIADPGLQPFEN